ncbi:hypothetical protein AB1Y20_000839 [Prymnesium parvum]|uniref:ACB domain-containing protein n=1 Tax=Prymnesium parvum TaxID=97485 RepID=A0AB34K6I0_PRYPA
MAADLEAPLLASASSGSRTTASREELLARGRQIFQQRRLGVPLVAVTPHRSTFRSLQPTPSTSASAAATRAAAALPPPHASTPACDSGNAACLPSPPAAPPAAPLPPAGGAAASQRGTVVGSAQSFLIDAVGPAAAAGEAAALGRRQFCEARGAFLATLEEARAVEAALAAEGSELSQAQVLLLALAAHGRALVQQSDHILEHLSRLQSDEKEAQHRLIEAKAENERLVKKIEIYQKRCAAVNEELASLSAGVEEAARARAERDELRESMGRALDLISAEKEAAERRAALAEAAVSSMKGALCHGSPLPTPCEAVDALQLQRWSSFIGHDVADEAADAALRSSRRAAPRAPALPPLLAADALLRRRSSLAVRRRQCSLRRHSPRRSCPTLSTPRSGPRAICSRPLPTTSVRRGRGASGSPRAFAPPCVRCDERVACRARSGESNGAREGESRDEARLNGGAHARDGTPAKAAAPRGEEQAAAGSDGDACDALVEASLRCDGSRQEKAADAHLTGRTGNCELRADDGAAEDGREGEGDRVQEDTTPPPPSEASEQPAGGEAPLEAPLLGFPEKFELCQRYVDEGPLKDNPSVTESDWLLLEALKQQALHGPCQVPSPGYMSSTSEARAKWKAWKELGNKSPVEAMYLFTQAVQELDSRWWTWPALGLCQREPARANGEGDAVAEPVGNGRVAHELKGDADAHDEERAPQLEPAAVACGGVAPAGDPSQRAPTASTPAAAQLASSATSGESMGDAPPQLATHGASNSEMPGDLEWRIEVIMRQHAEDCKRMNPSDAARFARQALNAVGVRGSARVGPAPSSPPSPTAPPLTAVWKGPYQV